MCVCVLISLLFVLSVCREKRMPATWSRQGGREGSTSPGTCLLSSLPRLIFLTAICLSCIHFCQGMFNVLRTTLMVPSDSIFHLAILTFKKIGDVVYTGLRSYTIETGVQRIPIEAYSTTDNSSLTYRLDFTPAYITVEGSDLVIRYTGDPAVSVIQV